MFGLGGYRLGSFAAAICAVVLILLRIYMVTIYLPGHRAKKDEGPQVAYATVPASSWLVFTTTDPATAIRTEHAKLVAYPEPPPATDAHPAPPPTPIQPNALELRETPQLEKVAIATLGGPTQATCLAIEHVGAAFDGGTPQNFAAKPDWLDGKCTVQLAPFDLFLQNLQNAQTLVITPHTATAALPPASWTVTGLSWTP